MDEQTTPNVEGPMRPSDHADCERRVAELEAKWKRAVADYANREKELTREREDFARFCTVDLIRDFLPIVDAAEAASRPHPPAPPLPEGRGEIKMNFSPPHGEGEREGVGQTAGLDALRKLCQDFLRRHGVEPIGAIGDRVDYLLHEVVGTRQTSKDFSTSRREGERLVPRSSKSEVGEGVGQENNVQGTILEVVQVGYTMHGRLLRPAKVIVCEEKR